ncbi:MAG: hypothetical protein EKK42_12185 [Pseudonocardiaceae bacterium]|nr:MAG: hypothetical protein EKK42_12185 [Pseudonocardiaceae bacterium]
MRGSSRVATVAAHDPGAPRGEPKNPRATSLLSAAGKTAVRLRATSMMLSSEDAADLRVPADMAAAGTVRPIIDRAFALEEAPATIDTLAAGRARGEFVVRVADAR